DYEIDLTDPDAPWARLSVRYQNLSSRPVGTCVQESRYGDTYADMMDRCYWDYVRAYVPAGSELLSGPDLSLPAGSLLARDDAASLPRIIHPTLAVDGWSVWTAFFDLPPMEEVQLVWHYQLPREVLRRGADGSYHYGLRVQKQAGTVHVPLRVRVSLPPGAELVAGSAIVETDLRLDREFLVTYRIGEAGP
ncbi:MAG: hypothetical protein ACP5JJ_11295, partial [Anaerolineae bacterium]